ncbi:UPF0481 protein At3g47200-like [Ziziphus jujuba]|uniref:UPF0481 protein At3g47200-like n=1 Tax=Ziziphus jujuba TaxID=326968 RepID=A0ABM4A2X8_ZIZJJ|nr:UPF0481 protein At3g47200-like [Ziziphus jujuba]
MEEQSEAAKEVVINMENAEGLHYEHPVEESPTPRKDQEIQEETPKIPKVPEKNQGPPAPIDNTNEGMEGSPAAIDKNNERPPDLPPELYFMSDDDESLTPRSNQQPGGRKIPKVPEMLRNLKKDEDCFYPRVVSIGPYHHLEPHLLQFMELKIKLAKRYCGNRAGIVDLYKRVQAVAGTAREFYNMERLNDILDDEAFTTMMFLDGCFILEFIMWLLRVEYYDIGMNNNEIANVKRDLFLLENQLPYIVLEKLMEGHKEYSLHKWKEKIENFITMCRRLPPEVKPWMTGASNYLFSSLRKQEEIFKNLITTCAGLPPAEQGIQRPLHLLDMTRTRFVKPRATFPSRRHRVWDRIVEKVRHCMGIRSTQSATSDWYSYQSARVLNSMGIRFRPNKTGSFSDVKFESQLFIRGVLTLPLILIDASTKPLLLNMLALESSCKNLKYKLGVTSYMCFMDSLIDNADDVMILRSQNVIVNCLGTDQDVADLFNDIAIHLVPDPHMYAEAKRGIQKYCDCKFDQWMAECYNTHFRSPWTLLALCAAISVILLTAAQTFLAVWQLKN